jgi:outer membrane protein assembly factor BamB
LYQQQQKTMIFKNIVRTSFFLALSAASVSAQLSALLDEPVELWTTQLLPDANLGSVEILKGNGVFMSPDGTTAMVTTVGGTVYAINAYNGEQKWAYQAPSSDSSSVVSSRGGVTVALDGSFLAFSVIDNENSVTPVS